MRKTIKIRDKLLLFWMASVFLLLLIFGSTLAYLQIQQHENIARNDITNDLVYLRSQINKITSTAIRNAVLLASQQEVVAVVNFVDSYQDVENYQPMIFNGEKADLAKMFFRQAETADLELVAAYDNQQRLISYAIKQGSSVRSYGFSSFEDGESLIYSDEDGERVRNESLALLQSPASVSFSSEQKTRMYVSGSGVVIDVTTPVTVSASSGVRKKVGTLRIAQVLDSDFIADIERQRKSEFLFAVAGHFSQGQLSHIELENTDNIPHLAQYNLKDCMHCWLPHADNFIRAAYLGLTGGNKLLLGFGQDKQHLSKNLQHLQSVAIVILVLSGIVLLPMGALFLRRVIFRPLEKLMQGVKALHEGEYARVELDTDDNELGMLAQSFNEMSQTLGNREEGLRKLLHALDQSPAAVIITSTSGDIEYVNAHFEKTTGYSHDEVVGKNPRFLQSGNTPKKLYSELWKTILNGDAWQGELLNRKKNGELYWESATISPVKDRSGKVSNFLAVKEDITLRKEYEEKLLHQAHFDSLTHLPNRTLAFDRLSQALALARRTDEKVAIVFIDLDQFKHINDSLGHAFGDALLVHVANRLKESLREGDTIARLGGDEFLVILSNIKTLVHIESVMENLRETLNQPFVIDGRELFSTASMGVSVFPDDGEEQSELLSNADSAMYQAKEAGRNTYCFFTPEMNEESLRRLEVEAKLRNALANNELYLHYQPQIEAASLKLVGVEALLRWDNPELGSVSPIEFIPLAESTGLIHEISEWVLNTACAQVASWREQGVENFKVAINTSAYQFKRDNLPQLVTKALKSSGLPADWLDIELTEGVLVENNPQTKQILEKLKSQGVTLTLDDFGTGYSSLSYVKGFPFDTLKIDRSFIRDICVDPEDASLTKAIISMANSLNLTVVAEGVETWEQLDILQQEGCHMIQGYYFSRPVAADEFTALLSDEVQKNWH
jgi:diguanylate cyclase (GGDEF)-like protein/PAS domain S-box-containing protein